MRNLVILLCFCLSCALSFAQELNCTVIVNAQQTGDENLKIFGNLERQLTEFINNTKWTKKTYAPQELINCSMNIIVTRLSGETFNATLQVQSSRPIYGSSYSSPIYNLNDEDFTFNYLEFQNLIYNPTQFSSNLISVLAFHIYIILGLDADAYQQDGGQEHFKQAQTILNYSQQENFRGWKLEDGLQSRFVLIDNLLSPTFKTFRNIIYEYHRLGLDVMSEDPKQGKEQIAKSLVKFKDINSSRPNSFLLRTFFDAKATEIEQVFSDGPKVNIATLKDMLQKIAPLHSTKWRNITY
jgi:hypothetical protein